MVVHNIFRRQIRITENVEDLNAYKALDDNVRRMEIPDDRLPILYVIRIEVKIFLIGWITIWAKSCDFTDGDTRTGIYQEALKIQKLILGVS